MPTKALAWTLAFGSGYLSLSEEILWFRFFGFAQQGSPHAFSLVLCLYLLGIALGAALGKRFCEATTGLLHKTAAVLGLAAALSYATPSLLGEVAKLDALVKFAAACGLVVVSAGLKAVVFPIAHHLATHATSESLGRSVSRVYAMNIVGATLGPLLTGFILLDHLSMEACFRWIGSASMLLAACTLWWQGRQKLSVALGGLILLATTQIAPDDSSVIRAFASKPEGQQVLRVVSNRHGVIHTVAGGPFGDIVYGSNAYDGRVNTDLRINSNRIDRVYLLAALHRQPKRVLVIGLSTGAWVEILRRLPEAESIDVIEINPGYLSLADQYSGLQQTLQDARVKVHIDDGRRWLRRHPDQKFDLIVMNTTFHWRSNITSLLSHQYLELVRQHLLQGGVLAYNGTGSPDVLKTATAVFPHAMQWHNFVYAADHDFSAATGADGAAERLLGIAVGDLKDGEAGGPAELRRAIADVLSKPFLSLSEVQANLTRPAEVIDDRLMQTEFKFGRGLALE